MHGFLNKFGWLNATMHPANVFCVLAYFIPAMLTGCVGGAQSLTAVIAPGALAQDMSDPAAPVLARLQQPDSGEGKPKPPANPLPAPPAPSALPPGLAPPPASALQLPNAPSPHDTIIVRAWVNGEPLYDDEFIMSYPQELLRQLALAPSEPRVKESLRAARERLIDTELMYQDAVNKLKNAKTPVLDKLKKDAEKKHQEQMYAARENFKKSKASLNEIQYRKEEAKFLDELRHLSALLHRRAEREYIAKEYMIYRVLPKVLEMIGPKEVKEEYEAHMNMYIFPGRLKWQDVFIPVGKDHPSVDHAKRFAEALLARHRNDFKSILPYDKGDSKHRGGDGVGTHLTYKLGDKTVPTDIRPVEMETHLLQLREGQSTIVEMATGVHIIHLAKFEPSKMREFTPEVQAEIRNKLRNEVFEREVRHLVRELHSHADIEIVAD